ncbi:MULTISPECIES: YusW family protein [unclassified Exiguobacterium]|uniref:YusW family protein n=1 Tax=unclassified Exiguobacterium TaxID=2644629 RepID=UPI0013F43E23|nr:MULTISPECIES: YusW family protein [unclassified Exiguobacterium]
MKRLKWALPVTATLLLLVGCGDADEVTNQPSDAPVENEANSENNSMYTFNKFELDVDYPNVNDAIQVEYETEMNSTEASYERKEDDLNLRGDEAMQELDSLFGQLNFDKDTPDEEVLNQIKATFNVEDAQSIEADVTFTDGTEKEYRE